MGRPPRGTPLGFGCLTNASPRKPYWDLQKTARILGHSGCWVKRPMQKYTLPPNPQSQPTRGQTPGLLLSWAPCPF